MTTGQLLLLVALLLQLGAVWRNTAWSIVRWIRMYLVWRKMVALQKSVHSWELMKSTHPSLVPSDIDEEHRIRLSAKIDKLLEENKRIHRTRNWLGR